VGEVRGKKRKNKWLYLIHWRGFDSDADTWEPEEHLNCTQLIEEYEKRHQNELEEREKFPQKNAKMMPSKKSRKSKPVLLLEEEEYEKMEDGKEKEKAKEKDQEKNRQQNTNQKRIKIRRIRRKK